MERDPERAPTLLLVEDEDAIRRLVQRVLSAQGYEILVARDGAAALALARSHPGPIDLMVTDLVMPHMGGREIAQALAQDRPETKILYVSGYAKEEVGSAGVQFLAKPFTPDALVRKVRALLGS